MNANKHADDLIEMLATAIEAGSAPWQKPWRCDHSLPTNLVTGKVYAGRNLLMLTTARALHGYDDHRWAGFHQIKSAGGHVRRGEHGQWICIMRTARARSSETDEDLSPYGSNGNAPVEPEADETERAYTYTMFRPVWNAAQCENIGPLEKADGSAGAAEGREPIPAGEAYLLGAPVAISIAHRDNACYAPASDEVRLPQREQFDDPLGFYHTALHELAHATGHSSRLDRRLGDNHFGSTAYIQEELVAEITAFLTSTSAGLGHGPGESASYIGGWLKTSRDIREKLRAALKDASSATQMLACWQARGYKRAARDADTQTPAAAA